MNMDQQAKLHPAAVLWGLQFLGGLASAPAYALFAVYVEQALQQTPLYTASLRSLQLALGGLSAPAAGALADRLGYKPAYIWGMTSTVAACAVFLTGQPLLLVVLFLYSGLLGSLQTTAGQAYLMEATGRSRLGRASAGYFLGLTLGTALGSAAAGRLASGPGYALLGAASTLLALALIAAALLLLPPLTRGKITETGRRGDGHSVFRRGRTRRGEGSEEREPTGGQWPGRNRSRSPARSSLPSPLRVLSRELNGPVPIAPTVLHRPEVRLLLGIRFLPTCYWGAVTLLVPLLLFRETGSPEAAGWYAGVSLVLASLCQIQTGRICDHSGVRVPLRLAPIGITVSALGLTLGAESVPALWAFGILGACAAWSLSITMPLLIDDVSRPGERGRMVGLTALAWSAGMLVGSLVAGKLASGSLGRTHPGLPFALTLLCGLGTIVLAAAISRRRIPAR